MPGAWGVSGADSLGTGRLSFHPTLRSSDHNPDAGDADNVMPPRKATQRIVSGEEGGRTL